MIAKDLKITELDTHRELWAQVAREHDWYVEPFYVQVWVNEENEIVDSVSYKGLTRDIVDQY